MNRNELYIDGKWTPAAGGQRVVFSPARAEQVGLFPQATAEEVDRAVQAAARAFPGWSQTTPAERARLLRCVADLLDERRELFIDTITAELGAPRQLAERVHLQLPITVLRATADLLEGHRFQEEVGNSTIYREPVGVVAAITPWNYPLHQITAKIVPALAAGCTIVLKPAELTPLTAYAFADAMHDVGFPAGVFNLVSGPGSVIGEALSLHPQVDMVSFTGSVNVGRTVARDAAGTIKRVSLELGGKSASLIAEDVTGDLLTTAVKVSVANSFLNSGQTCSAWTRLLVPEARYQQVKELAAEAARKYVPGDRLGPMISESHRQRVLGYMRQAEAAGFDLIHGGSNSSGLPERGWYIRPTIYGRVDPQSAVAQEEIFGPVLSVITYQDEDEAVEIANGTVFGLSGAVWSADPEHATALAKRLRTGQIDINGGRYNPLAPFGGYKQSGIGRELGKAGMEEFCEWKAVQR